MVAPSSVALATGAHLVCPSSVLSSTRVVPLGTCAAVNGSVTDTGIANWVPCGVKAKMSPAACAPAGNAGAPSLLCAIAIGTSCASAPGGTTILAPWAVVTVPPAVPIMGGCACGGDDSPPPPQAATSRLANQANARALRVAALSE